MLTFKKGDLFSEIREPHTQTIIPHIVNDIGAWGSGFVVPLGKYYPRAKKRYLEVHKLGWSRLGWTDFICFPDSHITVANMYAQTGIMNHSTGHRSQVNDKPIRYEALVTCMRAVVDHIKLQDRLSEYERCPTWPTKIIAPKFGSDRAGGNWDFIEELIEEIWADLDVTVFVLE